jgi:hypothetical protein
MIVSSAIHTHNASIITSYMYPVSRVSGVLVSLVSTRVAYVSPWLRHNSKSIIGRMTRRGMVQAWAELGFSVAPPGCGGSSLSAGRSESRDESRQGG